VPTVTPHERTSDATSSASPTDPTCVQQYEIRVRGRLGDRWTAWFDGLRLSTGDDGTTVITGPVVDQAALHGVLHKLRDVGMPLVSLTQLPSDASTAPGAPCPEEGI
jgi:hypothetical protein